MPRVYIIILNYKRWEDTVECLDSVFRSLYENYTVIVIDNDSQNDSLHNIIQWAEKDTVFANRLSGFSKDIIDKPIDVKSFPGDVFPGKIKPADFPKLILIRHNENKGFAGGVNPVLKSLVQEDAYIWLLNPDMVVEETTLSILVEFASRNPSRSVIGSVIKYYSNPDEVHLYGGGKINYNSGTVEMIKNIQEVSHLDYISGGSLFTHARNYAELGLLPEEYFLYWEETDWCYCAKNKGYHLSLCKEAVCYDKVSSSIGKSFLADYYYTRNGLIFLSKYKKEKVAIAVFFSIFRFLKRIMMGQPERAKGVLKGMLSFLNKDKHEYK